MSESTRQRADRLRRSARRACSTRSATTSGTRCSPTTRIYWVPLTPDQPEGLDHTSHLYEDKLLRDAARRAAEEPARVLAAAAEPQPSPAADADASSAFDPARATRYVMRSAVPLHRGAGRRGQLLRRHRASTTSSRARRRAAHDAEARRTCSTATPRCRRCSCSSERLTHRRTVHDRFHAHARRARREPISCASRPSTAAAYGIDAGARSWREAAAQVERAAPRLRRRPATATATASACCWRTGRRSSLHWFALNALGVSVVPIHADLRAAELAYLIGHSEIVLAVDAAGPRGRPAARRRGGRRAATLRPGSPAIAPTLPAALRRRRVAMRRSAATANARCSTPRAPPAGPRAACLANGYFLHAGAGTSDSATCARCGPTPSASSRRCR